VRKDGTSVALSTWLRLSAKGEPVDGKSGHGTVSYVVKVSPSTHPCEKYRFKGTEVMPYAERAYFNNDHCHHCAAWVDYQRVKNIRARLPGRLTLWFGV
jgi:hypothetical protein